MPHSVRFDASANDDLLDIYDWLWAEAGPQMAQEHTERIRAACMTLADYPNRGTPRSDLWPGLRTMAFRKSATIAYLVEGNDVRILRIIHRGRELSISPGDL